LFSGVISQIPLNLYLRGEAAAATKAAQNIETKFGGDAKRLLAISSFYVHIEQGGEATRLASQAVQLAPDLAEAHQSLGRALHISLRLDEAMAEYKRALELDPTSKPARRSLADLNRAFGKAEEALALYRQELEAEPKDKAARTGLILSLLDLNRTDEAKTELENALKTDARNLTLLAGSAYWFAAHNDSDLAIALGSRAVQIEPRYTWSQVALARALIADRKPLEAERSLRFARQYGRFPTLDYELANALVAAALYDEAAEILLQSFSFKAGQIETRLAGQTVAHSASFMDLLAPERRASIFQSVAADTEANAKLLRALLMFATALDRETPAGASNEESAIAAAREFASGDDAGRVHRQLYVAGRLLQRGIGAQAAYELVEAARGSAEAGMTVPALTIAVQADEYRDIRARAIAAGGTPDIPDAPRNVLSNLLRGRIEDLAGWAMFDQDKLDEAVDHLKRAVAILPEGTPAARISLWRLGAALDRQNKKPEALSYYIKSYNSGNSDPVRRTIIEQLYRKINGSLVGLDERIGPAYAPAPNPAAPVSDSTTDKGVSTLADPSSSPDNSPRPLATPSEPAVVAPIVSPGSTSPDASVTAVPTPSPETPSSTAPATSPTPAVPTSSPEPTPGPSASPTPETPSTTTAVADQTKAPPETASGERAALTITGRVKDAGGNPIANVVVVLIGPQGTVLASTTDQQGNYSFTVAPSSVAHSYRIIPSKDGLAFDPVDRIVSIADDDVKELEFVGTVKVIG
jgi:tetratricopeptide (TPR) repeat protein